MSEYISREELKRKISNWNFPSVLWDIVNDLPSADVRENIHGEWKKNFLGIEICSKCGEPIRDRRLNHRNFCNCCGADMRGET